ncbi:MULTISPECIES: TonB-dependent receptor [unclassified Carboxylicivirga]|uniref:TonB-dependent receptor n=1 Tax=Carboxylicivirga TaxID=1628153 RepID=UPI003D324E48
MRLYLLVIAVFSAIQGLSQNPATSDNSGDTIHHSLDEVSIRASSLVGSPEDWPGSISSLDSLSLQSANSFNIAEYINQMPGVLMQQGTLSTNRITIRGIGSRTPYNSNRIKAYWGNVPMTDGDGVTAIEDIALNDINAIQVLKGPSSALYGAGLGGVILIHPWPSPNTRQQLMVNSEIGRFSTLTNQLSLNFNSPKSRTLITAQQLSTRGYRQNSEYRRYNITLKGKYLMGKSQVNYLYSYRHLYGQIPSSLDSIDFNERPEKAADAWQAIGGYEKSGRHLVSTGLSTQFSSSLYHSANIFFSASDLDELRPFNQLSDTRHTIGLRDQLSFEKGSFKLKGGVEAMLEYNTLALFSTDDEDFGNQLSRLELKRSYVNLFLLAEQSIRDKLILQMAFNLNKTQYRIEHSKTGDFIRHQYPLIASPRIGLNYQLRPVMNIYLAAGHGFSAPSVEEAQMPDGSFNATVKPEEGYHLDIGWRYASPNKNTQLELTAYGMWMRNLLVTKRESEAIFYGVNAGKTKHRGIEMLAQHRLELSHGHELLLSSSFTHSVNTFVTFTDAGNDYAGRHLPGIPTYDVFGRARYAINNTSLNVDYRHRGSQFLNDSNNLRYEDYGVLNAKINQSFKFPSARLHVYLGLNNALNKHYASMVLINAPSFGNKLPRYYYPASPLHWYLGLHLTL